MAFARRWAAAAARSSNRANPLLMFGLALVLVCLVLAAQFNSFRDPLAVLVSLPVGVAASVASPRERRGTQRSRSRWRSRRLSSLWGGLRLA